MSQTVQATLEGVYPRSTSKGTVFDVKADGVQYNTWDAKLADRLGEMRNAPVVIEFEVKTRQSGDKTFTNRNIVTVVPLGGGASTSDNGASAPTSYQSAKDTERNSIQRQKALAEANAYGIASGLSSTEIVAVAGEYLLFIEDNEQAVLDELAEVGAEEV